MWLLLTLYSLLFTLLALRNFRLAVGLFIIGLPTYLIRLKLGPLPTTLLELNFGILFVVWLIKYARSDVSRIAYRVSCNRFFFLFSFFFFLSSLVSIFVSDMWYYSLGQWRAYFLEPTLLFIMLLGRTKSSRLAERSSDGLVSTDLIWFLALSTISLSLVAIIQKLTGQLYPPSLWDDQLFGRVTSFFTSPNAAGLYLGPIILLILGQITKYKTQKTIYYLLFTILLLAGLTLLLTKSLGALIAVALGVLLFILLVCQKKTKIAAVVIAILFLVPCSLFLAKSKFQSLGNRLTLWSYSWNYLTQSPKNFLFGAGIRQFFRKVQKPNYNPKELERLIYPHNIFLNFWTETGLIGMISFASIFYLLSHISYLIYKHSNRILGASLIAALIVLLLHGLIDVPYFKNDLAMLFWIIAALILASALNTKQKIQNTK